MSGPLLLPTWEQLEATHPQVVATMRAYLAQVACVLRPGSVAGADLALRSFTTYLAAEHPGLQRVRDVDRPHVEGFKTVGRGPARTEQGPRHPGHHRPPPRHPAGVLHPDRRMGLGRRTAPGADVPRRRPPPTPRPAQGPRRPDRRQAAARRASRPADARRGHRRVPPTHRATGRGVHRPDRRRRRPDRRHPLAPRPGRQAPRRPLPAAAPTHRGAHRHLPRRARPDRAPAAAAHGERQSRWTGTASPGSSTRPAPRPGSATSTPTSCGTPWPPRPSTAACPSRPSPRCSATSPWT